jgi:alpha-galactosidase
LRSNNNQLNKEQRYTLFLLNNILGSLLFTSDNIREYSGEELAQYQSIFPLVQKKIEQVVTDGVIPGSLLKIYFSIADRQYLAISNLGDKECNLNTKKDYFSKHLGFVSKNTLVALKPYQSFCFVEANSGEEHDTKWLL